MSTPTTPSVTILGQGVRAAGLARILADHTLVTVWDENSDVRVQAAVTSAAVILLCTDDPEAAARILTHADPHLASRDVVNLTSSTESQVRQLATQVTARGGRYLGGALMGHPEHVGRSETVLVYSGSPDLFQQHRQVLETLGSATFLGSDPATATLYETAMLNFAWATLVGYLHSAALLRTADIPAMTMTPLLTHWMSTTIAPVISDYAQQIDGRRYPGAEEWLELDAPLMDHLIQTAEERGVDPRLPQLVRSLTRAGIAAGFGAQSFASLIEIVRTPTAER
ncbi:NAD(P)-binding domain-containing protein [Nocardia sp. XZ_19_385]|uniref:imine reductase family protein n=1 Tax=Nocardia sp. XZ_19_385 TaxID=2769488 RepID=UPI00188E60F1|nr:NAD(P)-binding domain-containing protein [Nocardia sp. XZ_19_385]